MARLVRLATVVLLFLAAPRVAVAKRVVDKKAAAASANIFWDTAAQHATEAATAASKAESEAGKAGEALRAASASVLATVGPDIATVLNQAETAWSTAASNFNAAADAWTEASAAAEAKKDTKDTKGDVGPAAPSSWRMWAKKTFSFVKVVDAKVEENEALKKFGLAWELAVAATATAETAAKATFKVRDTAVLAARDLTTKKAVTTAVKTCVDAGEVAKDAADAALKAAAPDSEVAEAKL